MTTSMAEIGNAHRIFVGKTSREEIIWET